MSNVFKLFIMLCIGGAITLLSRELPFLLFRRRAIPNFILYLGKVLPMAIMTILVLYCIRNTSFGSPQNYLPQLVSLALVVLLHLWKRSSTLSIFGGTICYMILIRLL